MAVVKDEKPLWRAGLALSGPVIVVSAAALIVGMVNRSLLRSPTLRGMMLLMMALLILALGMLLWRIRPGTRRLRRWDVRLAILANLILFVLLSLAFFLVQPSNGPGSEITAPRSAGESSGP